MSLLYRRYFHIVTIDIPQVLVRIMGGRKLCILKLDP